MDDKVTNRLTEDKLSGTTRKLLCGHCRTQTNHIIVKSLTNDWVTKDEEIQGDDNYLVVKCLGCDLPSLCQTSTCSEWYYEDAQGNGEYLEDISQYPRVNIDFKLEPYLSTPFEVREAYRETYAALCNNMPKLSAAGMRLIIELVCLSHDIEQGKLHQKIGKLYLEGFITRPIEEMLYSVKNFGNKSVHELKTPTRNELVMGWEAINTLLRAIYGTQDVNKMYEKR